MSNFSERLKRVLKEKGITQVALAKMIGMSQGVVNNYCTGKREPSLDALSLICKATGETADFFLGIEDF